MFKVFKNIKYRLTASENCATKGLLVALDKELIKSAYFMFFEFSVIERRKTLAFPGLISRFPVEIPRASLKTWSGPSNEGSWTVNHGVKSATALRARDTAAKKVAIATEEIGSQRHILEYCQSKGVLWWA